MVVIIIFITGLCVGSFLNVLIDRIPRRESVLFGRSHCDYCKKKLGWYELIPVVSFLIQNGRCRKCKKFIGWKYVLIEVLTAVVFVYLFVSPQVPLVQYQVYSIRYVAGLFFEFILASSLIVIFIADLQYGIIPDKVLYPTIVITFLYQILSTKYLLLPDLFSAVAAFLFFLILFIVTRGRGMGFGDVKYVFLMGLLLGFPGIIVGLYVAFLTGAICGAILVLWGKKKFAGGTIPFGPFLVTGTVVSLLFGNYLIQLASNFLP